MRNKLKNAVLLLIVCACGLLVAGCGDAILHVEGTTYEWIDAPASFKGIIYVDEEVDLSDKNLQPLSNVLITTDYTGTTDTSDATGSFDIFATGFGTGTVAITVEKNGYYTIETTFFKELHESYDVIILMVRDE